METQRSSEGSREEMKSDGLPSPYYDKIKGSDIDLCNRLLGDDPRSKAKLHHADDRRPLPLRDIIFKSYVIFSMTFVWSGFSLLLRYTRTRTDRPMYLSTTVVFLAEVTKFVMAAFLLLRTHHYNLSGARNEFKIDFVGKPYDLLKMSVPSITYAVQNNLDFVALSNLDPGVYQVTCQLKVVTTAVFMVLMLGRRYSMTRWLAIVFLFGGVALVQLDAAAESEAKSLVPAAVGENRSAAVVVNQLPKQNYFVGITAVLATCVTAGFAGVYFERMLKDASSSLWIRNLQMYFCGIISAGLACLLKEGSKVAENGFFYGYDPMVWAIVGLLSVGGIYISLVIKYLDNLLKSFASAVSISVVAVMAAYIFGSSLGLYFLFGSTTVCGAILLYSSVPE